MKFLTKRKINKKGDAAGFILATVGIFVVGLMYIVMAEPFTIVKNQLNESINNSDFSSTVDRINTIWEWWPIIMILGIIIWAILMAIRRQTGQIEF